MWRSGLYAAVALTLTVAPSPNPIREAQWHLDFLHIDQVHQIARGAGVVVGLIDTGVDNHPDLAGSVLPGADFGPLKSDGRKDISGHGTAMAGLIVGHGQALGIAPEAKILPVKPLFANEAGGVVDTEEPVRWAVDHGANIISLSIGDDAPNPAWGRAIQYAISKDVVVVAAVNNTTQGTHPSGLAMAPGVVVVSGVDKSGRLDPISLTGDVVTVAAPARDCWSTRLGGKYGSGTGTSNSTAITAGVVALIRSRFPDLDGQGVVRRLTATARDEGAPGRDPLYGFGVIDPLRALTETDSATQPTIPPATQPAAGRPLWTVVGGAIVVIVLLLFAALWWGQRKLIYFPDTSAVPSLPDAQDVTLETSDGLKLGAWLFSPGRPITVLVANGNGGNRVGRIPLARALVDKGFSVLLFDYRGYGDNPGSPSERGLALDVRAARAAVNGTVIYFGESLGSAVVTELATEIPPAALVLRSPFVDLASVGATHYPYLPVRMLLRERFPTAERIARVRVPTVIIYGTADSIVPASQSRAVADRAAGPVTVVEVAGADHNDPVLLDGQVLIDAIVSVARPLPPA